MLSCDIYHECCAKNCATKKMMLCLQNPLPIDHLLSIFTAGND